MVLAPATANAALSAIIGLMGAAGKLKLFDDSDNLLATLSLPSPAFGTPVDGTAIIGTVPDGTATGEGTASAFQITDTFDTLILSGTVGLADDSPEPDLILTNTDLNVGDGVSVLSSLVLTQPTE